MDQFLLSHFFLKIVTIYMHDSIKYLYENIQKNNT